ncbi:GtrA family protein [Streptomyces sp. ICN441]|uniref:GtrA family protein n=1 Tax=Streptomyces sp. ICN441 TaxID=2558286 RepID=UPI0003A014B2|nr:GtrA family protein [Streptomyces sp. ICN441]TFE39098.1 GtrA family protein [Streptomyces sp. ICN441]
MNAAGLRQFAVFALVGVVNTGVYYGVYALLLGWLPYLAAHALAYGVGVTGSFLLNSCVTLRTRPTWRAFVRYPLSGAAGLVGSGVLLHLAVSRLGMDEHVAAIAAGVLATPLTFLVARWAILSGARRTVTEPASSE